MCAFCNLCNFDFAWTLDLQMETEWSGLRTPPLVSFVQIIPKAGGPDQKSDRHWLIGSACITAGVIMSKCNLLSQSEPSERGRGEGPGWH